ncbi:hypothetical protein CMUST_10140 [Corynebacterium mustelae]|uniref:Uncharacterized protein n=1 Tax=Corynebacterium mustelae TaxID=571915 RepID=A0A0G3GYV2_9CORY|nr:hypothetical protein [Corynebacterium mustelae]AKK06344.1 hypothetical protein CMUST_10140 [Corynebacterium mustelae]
MTFSQEVLNRLHALSATIAEHDGTLLSALSAISFPKPPKAKYFTDPCFSEFEAALILQTNRENPRDAITWYDIEWNPYTITPFTPGTADFEEWDGIADGLKPQLKVDHETPTLIAIANHLGTGYVVVAEDPNPEDPDVYVIDHDLWLGEIDYDMKFSEFLDRFATEEEFQDEVADYFRTIKDEPPLETYIQEYVKTNPHLHDAVAVFKELNWHTAKIEDAPTLPLGTTEQQERALRGLETGDWEAYADIPGFGHTRIPATDVDEEMLGLFAIRLGVTPKRAAEVISDRYGEQVAAIVEKRGADFATEFINHSSTRFPYIAVRLVLTMGLTPPTSETYIETWASMLKNTSLHPDFLRILVTKFQPSFEQHWNIAKNTPAASLVIPNAVAGGLLDRDEAIDCAFRSLAESTRPSDRKKWVIVIADDLKLSAPELHKYLDTITKVAATHETVVIDKLVLDLLPILSAEELSALVPHALQAKAAKTRKAVVACLASRPELKESLAPVIADIPSAQQLFDAWERSRK